MQYLSETLLNAKMNSENIHWPYGRHFDIFQSRHRLTCRDFPLSFICIIMHASHYTLDGRAGSIDYSEGLMNQTHTHIGAQVIAHLK